MTDYVVFWSLQLIKSSLAFFPIIVAHPTHFPQIIRIHVHYVLGILCRAGKANAQFIKSDYNFVVILLALETGLFL